MNLGINLQPLVLALLETQSLYGYEIARRAKAKAGLHWKEGTLYPLLHKMEAEGLLRSRWTAAPNGKSRKYYSVTRKGTTVLAGARAAWKGQARVVARILLGGSHGTAGEASS